MVQVLIDAVVHAVNEDYDEMAGDFIKLGFLSAGEPQSVSHSVFVTKRPQEAQPTSCKPRGRKDLPCDARGRSTPE